MASKAVSARQLLEKSKYSPQSNLCELHSTVINDGDDNDDDKLINHINPTNVEFWVKPTVHPCQKKFDEAIISSEDDYVNLVNTVQRQSKCSLYYCLR